MFVDYGSVSRPNEQVPCRWLFITPDTRGLGLQQSPFASHLTLDSLNVCIVIYLFAVKALDLSTYSAEPFQDALHAALYKGKLQESVYYLDLFRSSDRHYQMLI